MGCGVYLLMRSRSFSVVLGLLLLTYGVDLFVFAAGRLHINQPPLIGAGEPYADPLPQALVLTAIVIGFAMTAFLLTLVLRALSDLGSDRVDDRQGEEEQ